MEIEYQNRYVVKWCLDRQGPRICLRAITTENQLRTIEIQSEGFNLKLVDNEARDFLNILNKIASTQYSPDKSVQEHVPDVPEEIISEVKPPIEEQIIADIAPTTEELMAPDVPDTSEIIQVLKESERAFSEITPSSPDDTSIVVPKVEEPSIQEVEKEIIKETAIITEALPAQEEPEAISSEIETASFFQQSISKSPLEMLLEGEEGEKETEEVYDKSRIEPEEQYTPPTEAKVAYSPEDLETETFFSQFDTKNTVDLIPKPQAEPEPVLEPEPEPKPEYKRVIELEPTPKFVKKEPVKTEVERRAEIEKERAERRRRLWELTRGF
ncbi:MAG: hypothetical protein ACFFDC_14865 [Promethearchaeota archaeon]